MREKDAKSPISTLIPCLADCVCRRVRVGDSNNLLVLHYILEEHPAAADVVEDGLHDPARADEAAAAGAPNADKLH